MESYITNNDDVMLAKELEDPRTKSCDLESHNGTRLDDIRPPTRRAFVISPQSSETKECEKNFPLPSSDH